MNQRGATLQNVQEEWRGVGGGVEKRWVGADRVVHGSEKGKAGSPYRGRAVHGTGMKLW